MHVHSDYCLDLNNTLGLSAKAHQLVCLDHEHQLPDLQELVRRQPNCWVLGGGSNVVLAPKVKALVIKVQTTGVQLLSETDTEVIVEAQAGENWHQFVQCCLQQGWWGLENLALIPGTVGAAPVQNIGAYGVELQQFVHRVRVWDLHQGKAFSYEASQCGFGYRDSLFKQAGAGRYVIVAVQFKLTKPRAWLPVLRYPDLVQHQALQQSVTAPAVFDAVVEIRQAKLPDPTQLANAGSFFKNPIVATDLYEQIRIHYPTVVAYPQKEQMKLAAGWLIEHAGWKGKQLGPVGMHARQALVLVNYGGATYEQVQQLVLQVKADVWRLFQVELEQEPINMA